MGSRSVFSTIHCTNYRSRNRLRCILMTFGEWLPTILAVNVAILTVWVIVLDNQVTKLKKIIG